MSEATKGILVIIFACTIWGLSALFYRLIANVPPLEVLAHRTIWSLVFLLFLLFWQRRLGELRAVLSGGTQLWLMFSASLLISANWFFFIFSVQTGRVVESSLGYFIFPLVAVAFGYLLLGERLSPIRIGAVCLAALAVTILTLGLGATPWISLILASSMAGYGVVKKKTTEGPVVSVAAEVALLAPFAFVWIFGVHNFNWVGFTGRTGGFFGQGIETLWLILAGPLTAGPLVLLSYSMKRLTLSTLGLIQYWNPTLQALVATLVLGELFTIWHGITFGLIWIALALYSWDSQRHDSNSAR